MSKSHMAISTILFVLCILTTGVLSWILWIAFAFSLFSSQQVRAWLDYFYSSIRAAL